MIEPIVEFLSLDWTESKRQARWEILNTKNSTSYIKGVIETLKASRGIYLFYDSRGRSLYAGKAVKLPLWNEINNAANRDRKDLQKVKLVGHPERNVQYRPYQEKIRQPTDFQLPLHDLAHYVSVYAIADTSIISQFEALIVRAFANDLLNKKMEKFAQVKQSQLISLPVQTD